MYTQDRAPRTIPDLPAEVRLRLEDDARRAGCRTLSAYLRTLLVRAATPREP